MQHNISVITLLKRDTLWFADSGGIVGVMKQTSGDIQKVHHVLFVYVYVHVNAQVCILVSLLNMDMMGIVTTCCYRMTAACKTFQRCAKFAFIDTTVG